MHDDDDDDRRGGGHDVAHHEPDGVLARGHPRGDVLHLMPRVGVLVAGHPWADFAEVDRGQLPVDQDARAAGRGHARAGPPDATGGDLKLEAKLIGAAGGGGGEPARTVPVGRGDHDRTVSKNDDAAAVREAKVAPLPTVTSVVHTNCVNAVSAGFPRVAFQLPKQSLSQALSC